MKNILITALLLTTSFALAGGREPSAPTPIGGQRDTHGCLSAAGQSWSVLKNTCVQPWDAADARMTDPTNPQLAVYVAFSKDRQHAELLGHQLVLRREGQDYVSANGATRLVKDGPNWSLKMKEQAPIGGDKDEHGCLSAAGYTWSALRGECVQTFSVANIRLPDPKNPTLAVYVLLSQDQKKAELFGMGYEGGVMLNQTATGYASTDGKVKLERVGKGWKLR